MYRSDNLGNVYVESGCAIGQFVGNWILQGYQSLELFLAANKEVFL